MPLPKLVIAQSGVALAKSDKKCHYPNRKIILTNANDDQLVEFGMTKLPYELFTLKHNPDKTDPDYFVQMLKAFKLDASDAIYFEHNPDAVKSAQSLGIASYPYNSDTRDLDALKTFLNENL